MSSLFGKHDFKLGKHSTYEQAQRYPAPTSSIQVFDPSPVIGEIVSMALPVVKSLADCVSLEKTVLPYTPQLYDLPQQLLQTVSNPYGLVTLYIATNPLISAFALSLFLAPIFLVVSEVNRNYSQVDRCWSLLPTIYNAHYALYAHLTGLPTGRMDALFVVSVMWSVSKDLTCSGTR